MIERSELDGVLTLRLAHGKASALDVELLEALLGELEGAKDAREVVLTGTGSIFSAGVDLFRITGEGAPYVRRFLPLLSRFIRTLFAYPKPVVAAVNGHAIAGGCIMALASDVKLMADGKGTIGVPELLVGVQFPAAALEVVRFAVPQNRIQSLVYLGRNLPPHEALAAGLVDEVVAPDALLPGAQEIARQLAAVPAKVFQATKSYLRAAALERIDAMSPSTDAAALEVWCSPATHAHITDYLKRMVRK
jgi:enoyl-CoA hydratase